MDINLDLLSFAREVVFSPSRFLGFFGGRRLGKSETFKRFFILKAMEKPGYRLSYLTPTAGQNEEVFESLLDYEGLDPFIARKKSRPCRLWLTNGSYLGCNSFQRSRNIRGRFFDCVWGDESQDLVGTEFWKVCRPMLSDKRGQAVVSGQLPSKGHWTYKDFYEPGQAKPGSKENPLDNGVPRYASWAIPSWEGPVFWGESGKQELEISRAQMPAWMFDAEYGCKPTATLNSVFPPDRLSAITGKKDSDVASPFVIGHDIGRVIDPGAHCVMDHDGYVVKTGRFPLGMRHSDQAFQLKQLSEQYGNALVVLDATGNAGNNRGEDDIVKIYRDTIKNSRSVYMPWQNKQEIVSCLCIAVEQKKIRIDSDHRELLEEMGEYEATYRGGTWRYSAPNGKHDDLVMALALCAWAKKKGWFSIGSGRTLQEMLT